MGFGGSTGLDRAGQGGVRRGACGGPKSGEVTASVRRPLTKATARAPCDGRVRPSLGSCARWRDGQWVRTETIIFSAFFVPSRKRHKRASAHLTILCKACNYVAQLGDAIHVHITKPKTIYTKHTTIMETSRLDKQYSCASTHHPSSANERKNAMSPYLNATPHFSLFLVLHPPSPDPFSS